MFNIRLPGGAPASQLAPEILPGFDVSLGLNAEQLALAGIRRFAQTQFIGAGAAQVSDQGIRNPTGSGKLVVIEMLSFSAALNTAILVKAGPQATDALGVPTPMAPTDLRFASPGVTSALVGSSQSAGGSGNHIYEQITEDTANEQQYFQSVPIILPPGFSVTLETGAVNLSFSMNVRGYERDFEPLELNVQ